MSGIANWGRRVAKAGRVASGATGAARSGSFAAMRGPRSASLHRPFNLPVLGHNIKPSAPRFTGGALPKRIPGATMGAGFPSGPLALGAGPAARAPGAPLSLGSGPARAAARPGSGGGLPRGSRVLGSGSLGSYHAGARRVRGGVGIGTHKSPEFSIGHDLGSRAANGMTNAKTARKAAQVRGKTMGGAAYRGRPGSAGPRPSPPRPGTANRPPPGTHAPPSRTHARTRQSSGATRSSANAPPRAQRPPPRAPSPSRGLVVPGAGRAAPSAAMVPAHRPPPPPPPGGSSQALGQNARNTSSWLLKHKYKIAVGGLAAVGAAGFVNRRGSGTGQSSGGVPTGIYGY